MVRLTVEIETENIEQALSTLRYINDTLLEGRKITAVEIEPVTPAYTQTLGYPYPGQVIYNTPSTGADNT